MLLIFILYFLYATIFIIGKFAINVCQPVFLTGVRMGIAGILSYVIHCSWYRCPQFRLLGKRDWVSLFLLALFNVYITNAGEFWSLQYLSAGKTAFIYNLSPFFVLIFSAMLFSEHITVKKIIGMIIGFVSLIPMLFGTSDVVDTTMKFGFLSMAEIIMLCSAAATAMGWVLMHYFIRQKVFTPYFLNGVSLTLGGIMCLVHAWFFEVQPFVAPGYMNEFWLYMLAMMLIQNLGAYNFHAYLLHRYSATLIALFSFVLPLMTVFLEYLFLDEVITMKFFVCSVGVAIGLAVFYQEDLHKNYLGKV